jgi:hypothetical protein
MHNSDASRREKVVVYLAVIARSEATKQSILSLRGEMGGFASLAMMVLGWPWLFNISILIPGATFGGIPDMHRPSRIHSTHFCRSRSLAPCPIPAYL